MTETATPVIPTRWMVEQMTTDVSIMGYSRWNLHDSEIRLNRTILTIIRSKFDDLCLRRLEEITTPFFVGRHHNPVTNHHDGTYTVSIL